MPFSMNAENLRPAVPQTGAPYAAAQAASYATGMPSQIPGLSIGESQGRPPTGNLDAAALAQMASLFQESYIEHRFGGLVVRTTINPASILANALRVYGGVLPGPPAGSQPEGYQQMPPDTTPRPHDTAEPPASPASGGVSYMTAPSSPSESGRTSHYTAPQSPTDTGHSRASRVSVSPPRAGPRRNTTPANRNRLASWRPKLYTGRKCPNLDVQMEWYESRGSFRVYGPPEALLALAQDPDEPPFRTGRLYVHIRHEMLTGPHAVWVWRRPLDDSSSSECFVRIYPGDQHPEQEELVLAFHRNVEPKWVRRTTAQGYARTKKLDDKINRVGQRSSQ